jgi:hypothetical protein
MIISHGKFIHQTIQDSILQPKINIFLFLKQQILYLALYKYMPWFLERNNQLSFISDSPACILCMAVMDIKNFKCMVIIEPSLPYKNLVLISVALVHMIVLRRAFILFRKVS